MPEQEFEAYLDLLARFLKLAAGQRDEVARELRDHLETRLAELTAEGHSRDAAVRLALDEFGAAAELAEHFSQLNRRRRRRLVMRWTFGTTAMLLVAILAWWSIAPERPGGPPIIPRLVAQDTAPPAVAGGGVGGGNFGGEMAAPKLRETELQQKLQTPMQVEFVDNRLNEVIDFLAHEIKADIIVDWKSLEEAGVTEDTTFTLRFIQSKPKAATILDLILGQHDLTYTERDGFLFVETRESQEAREETRLYDVRTLLAKPTPLDHGGAAAAMDASAEYGGEESFGGGFGGGMGPSGGMGMPGGAPGVYGVQTAEYQLVDALAAAVGPELTEAAASARIFRGVLIVRAHAGIHQKIEGILLTLEAMLQKPRGK